MSVIDTLITDRTDADVSRRAYLKERVENETATGEEIAEWLTDLKGAYNYSDWNRVGEACAYLYNQFVNFDYSVPGYTALPTNYTRTSIPDSAAWATYLSTINALKSVWGMAQEIPSTMEKLDVDGANNIEKLLADIDFLFTRLVYAWVRSAQFDLYSSSDWRGIPTGRMDAGRTWEELDAMDTAWTNWQVATWYLLLYGNLKAEGTVT